MVEYFQNKYSGESVTRILGEGEDMSDEITQQGLLPGVKYVCIELFIQHYRNFVVLLLCGIVVFFYAVLYLSLSSVQCMDAERYFNVFILVFYT